MSDEKGPKLAAYTSGADRFSVSTPGIPPSEHQRVVAELSAAREELEKRQASFDEALALIERAKVEIPALETNAATVHKALEEALAYLDAQAPRPSHEGFCGPWANCDGDCMDAARYAETTRPWREALRLNIGAGK